MCREMTKGFPKDDFLYKCKEVKNKMTKTKWRKEQIPKCKFGKNHKWKSSPETGICLKCGYDVFDECYKSNEN